MAEVLSKEVLQKYIDDYKKAGASKKEELHENYRKILSNYSKNELSLDIKAYEEFADFLKMVVHNRNKKADIRLEESVVRKKITNFFAAVTGKEDLSEDPKFKALLEEAETKGIERDEYGIPYIEKFAFYKFINECQASRTPSDEAVIRASMGSIMDKIRMLESKYFNTDKFSRIRSPYSDLNQYLLDKVALQVYFDMGIIKEDQKNKISPEEVIDVISEIKDLKGKQANKFSERFVNLIIADKKLFELVPPSTLANAYVETKKRVSKGGKGKKEAKSILGKIAKRMDDLSDNFEKNVGYYFVNQTNIADVYDGYMKMFKVRYPDLKKKEKKQQIRKNRKLLNKLIKEYDTQWHLINIKPKDSARLENNWDGLMEELDGIEISKDILELAAKYKFLDEGGNRVPQFNDALGNPVTEYTTGCNVASNSNLSKIIELAKHDVAKMNVGKATLPDDENLAKEVNDRITSKLFEIDTAGKIVEGIFEKPNQFTKPEYLDKFADEVESGKGSISPQGFELAMDDQVNKTAGFCGRIKPKLEDEATGFFTKVFKPLRDIDARAKDRIENKPDKYDKRKKRIDFFIRILKGFGNAFLISAAITVIATAGAAVAGISIAAGVASIGIITGIVMGAIQIYKWRKRQEAAGQSTDIQTFLKDKRMLATLGTTAIAAIAMIFGLAGLSQAAAYVGYGSLAIGSGSNAFQTFNDAKAIGMSTAESITWALANIAATIAGGFCDRTVAKAGIEAFNESRPENEIFQHKTSGQEKEPDTKTTIEKQVYKPEALDTAKQIAKMWYQDDPARLQRYVDLVKQYNTAHGTNVDPYRAAMLNADAGGQTPDNMALHVDGGGHVHSGGNHNVINTDQWKADHNFRTDEMNALRDLFKGGTINDEGMKVAMRVDKIVSAANEVGTVTAGDAPHYDRVLPQNTTDRNGVPVFNTYAANVANGEGAFHTVKETFPVLGRIIYLDKYIPVDDVPGVSAGMLGMSNPRTEKAFPKLKTGPGSLMDKNVEEKEPAVIYDNFLRENREKLSKIVEAAAKERAA